MNIKVTIIFYSERDKTYIYPTLTLINNYKKDEDI